MQRIAPRVGERMNARPRRLEKNDAKAAVIRLNFKVRY